MDNFVIPEFLKNKDPKNIHAEMLELLPEDIDKSEGGYHWDNTYPTAYELAKLAQDDLPHILMQIWPRFATGEYLDYHAQTRKIKRKEATYATGNLIVTGENGLKVPAGSIFSTLAVNDETVYFKTLNEAVTNPDGVPVSIEAVEAGNTGNVIKDSIRFVISEGLTGITDVTNPEDVTGGYDEEGDEELRSRILEFDESPGGSFIGNVSDYHRWATSVTGVGEAVVVPAEDNSGVVTIILMDSNGAPASKELCDKVYGYIMCDDDPMRRLAPANAKLSIIPPETVKVQISAVVELKAGYLTANIQEAFQKSISDYYKTAVNEGTIKYSEIYKRLSGVEGLNDHKELKLNGGVSNLILTNGILPQTTSQDIELTEGVV